MRSSVYFVMSATGGPTEGPPDEVMWEVDRCMTEADRLLREAGFALGHSDEEGYVLRRLRRYIVDRGIGSFVNTVRLTEAVMPDKTPPERYVPLLTEMLNKVSPREELLLIDPYLFAAEGDPDYIPFARSVLGQAIAGVRRLRVVTKASGNRDVEGAFRAMAEDVSPGIDFAVKRSSVFHDRFWVADGARGLVVGTSLNGIGKRYAFADYLDDEDAAAIYARYQELP